MDTPATVFCGFADVMLHKHYQTIDHVLLYNSQLMQNFPKMRIDEVYWHKNYAENSKRLTYTLSNGFPDYDNEMASYVSRFSPVEWNKLTFYEKNHHSCFNCLECVQYKEFAFKKANESFIKKLTTEKSVKSVKVIVDENGERVQLAGCMLVKEHPAESVDICDVPLKSAEHMTAHVEEDQPPPTAHREAKPVSPTNTSTSKRRSQHRPYKKSISLKHSRKLTSCVFNTRLAERFLQVQAKGSKHLGNWSNGKWRCLALKAGVRFTDNQKTEINGKKVMQEFAASLGYTFQMQKRKRNYKKLSKSTITSYQIKYKQAAKEDKISERQVDLGTPICPIITKRLKYNLTEKKLCLSETTVYGRKISLRTIREQHLRLMVQKGLLRCTDVSSQKRQTLLARLKHLNVGIADIAPVRKLREKVVELETTRRMVIWHVNAEVAGHLHYVVAVWYLYDEATYKTQTEMGFDVQSVVEQPFLHMIGRLTSAGQLEYVKERVIELEQSLAPIEHGGRSYRDEIRFNSGDLAARRFESGQRKGGLYPCPCGRKVSDFKDLSKALQLSPFYSLNERVEASKKAMESQSNVDTSKVMALEGRDELNSLDEKMEAETSQDLRNQFKSMRRLPALCRTGKHLDELNCKQYEVVFCDPLHDVKNLIRQVLEQLPVAMDTSDIQKAIANFCRTVLEERNCDVLRRLVDLTLLLQERQLKLDDQARNVYQMLLTLCDIQKLAHGLSAERCPRNVLRFHLQSLKFAILFSQIFEKCSRKAFSNSYHSVVNHLAELYRITCLRSIATEGVERIHHTLKQMPTTAYKTAEKTLNNVLTKIHKLKDSCNGTASSLNRQARLDKISISLLVNNKEANRKTFLTNEFIQENRMAVLWTFRRIADYLAEGPGVWYKVEPSGVRFHDGYNDSPERRAPKLYHFRSMTLRTMHTEVDRAWLKCQQLGKKLKFDQIVDFSAFPATGFCEVESQQVTTDQATQSCVKVEPVSQLASEVSERANVTHPAGKQLKPAKPDKETEVQQQSDEAILAEVWEEHNFSQQNLTEFLHTNFEAEADDSEQRREQLDRLLTSVEPCLKKLEVEVQAEIANNEKEYYKKNKKFPTHALDKKLERKRKIVTKFLRNCLLFSIYTQKVTQP